MLIKPESCQGCPLFGCGRGFVPADGSGRNGVLIVLEAAGADEEVAGLPVVGKAGYYLFTQLSKVGLNREDFRIHNVLSCRPPDNKLAGEPYETTAIDHCRPNLDRTVRDHCEATRQRGLTPVILALGAVAFKRVMGIETGHPILKEDYHSYIHWSDQYGCWVIAAFHPAFLLRGQHQYVPLLQFAAQRAVEVAEGGFQYHEPRYLCDPSPTAFAGWVRDYFDALQHDPLGTFLSFDIETPMKSKKGEDQLAREDDEDYIILRCAFSYQPGHAVSVPWRAEYTAILEDIFADPRNQLVTWNGNYDIPRVKAQMEVKGTNHDAMLAWHVLNSALDKRLGFVAPFYAKDARMWKHLSGSAPAAYNAQDADMALRCYLGIRRDLERADQMYPFQRHVLDLNRKCLDPMSAAGLLRDEQMRAAAEERLSGMLHESEVKIQQCVPEGAKKLKVYKKAPRDTTGMKLIEREIDVKVCDRCGAVNPLAAHRKSIGKKRLKAGEVENPCVDAGVVAARVRQDVWAKELEWKISNSSLQAYTAALKQQVFKNREGNPTFDEDAILKMLAKYPNDPLYPLILDFRKVQKLRGTYVGVTQPDGSVKGGLRTGRDGFIHPEFTHNPSTLRLACQNPNMQNLPRVQGEDDLATIVRNLIVARPGHILLEADFSAIEAVLVGYFARDPDYIRLAKLGVHSYLASHVLGRPADLKWSDADLKAYFKEIKKSPDVKVQNIYNGSKRTVHLSAYGGRPRKMHQAEPDIFPSVKYAEKIQGIYFDICPLVLKWQLQTQMDAHQQGYLRNPFGYVHRFTHVFRNVKEAGKWVRKPGDQANDVLAFLPQSTAAAIIKEAMLRIAERYPEVGACMRLQVHDSLVLEVLEALLDDVRAVLVKEMERPVPELRLPASYQMGECLSIDVESKVGRRWGQVK